MLSNVMTRIIGFMLIVGLVITSTPMPLQAATGNVLFSPAETDEATGTSYTRVIRLEHNGAYNGRLLATFEYFQTNGFPIYESLDDGLTWSANPVATVRDTFHPAGSNWFLKWQPDLFELPQQVGDLPAGTILLAGNTLRDYTEYQLQLYYSTDRGRTWTYRSTIIASPASAGGAAVWEPNIQVAGDGSLVAYYSSERHKDQCYNQLLAHKRSTDGGITWGSEVYDVAINGSERPGMAVVKKLPDNRYVMSYERVGGPYSHQVHIKFSNDGLTWGSPADPGLPVQTAWGSFPGGTPYIVWVPAGGANGALIVSAQFQSNTSGVKLFVNYELGTGPWYEMTAPIQYNGGNDHAGWSQGMLATADGLGVLHLASSSFGNGSRSEIRYGRTVVPAPTTSPAIVNPGFEANAGQIPNGWSLGGPNTNANFVEPGVNTGGSHAGSYHNAHWLNGNYEVSTCQGFTNLTNRSYTVGAWTQSTGGQEIARMELSGYGGTTFVNAPTGTANWAKINTTINITTNALTLCFHSKANGSAGQWLRVDDVSIFPTLVVNGGFEVNTGQTSFGWSLNGSNTSANFIESGANTGGSHGGSSHNAHWLNGSYEVSTCQNLSALTNRDYVVRAWTQSTGGQEIARMELSGYGSTTNINAPTGSSTWAQMSAPINITTNALTICFHSKANGSAGQWLRVDDVSVE